MRKSSLCGTTKSCTEIVDVCRTIGVNEIACLIDFGVRPDDDVIDFLKGLKTLKDATNKQAT